MAGSPSSNDELNEEEEGETFEVERILGMRMNGKKKVFLIRWKGFDQDEDTWEPEDNLDGAKDIVSRYLEEKEAEKTAAKAATGTKKGRKKGNTTGQLSSRPSKRTPDPREDAESDAASEKSDKSDEEFSPKKKMKKSPKSNGLNGESHNGSAQKSLPGSSQKSLRGSSQKLVHNSAQKSVNGSSQKSANGTPTHMEKAVARRQNISNNMRWIEDSSDDSGNDDDVQEVVINEESTSPSDNIHPDSSTDTKQRGSKAEASTGNNSETSTNNETPASGLKIKIAVKGDLPPSNSQQQQPAPPVVVISEEIVKERKHKKSKKHKQEKERTRSVHSVQASTSNPASLNFTGIYKDEATNSLCFIATDKATGKKEVHNLADAFAADGWGLCRYLANKVVFQEDGQAQPIFPSGK